MMADESTFWAMRRKVAPPSWLIATPTMIAPPTPRALMASIPAAIPMPMLEPVVQERELETDWLPSRSFGGCTGWA